jgi:hypothetical protein
LRREPLLAEISDLDEIVVSLVNVVGTAYSEHFGTDEFVKAVVDAIQKDNVVDMSDAEAEVLRTRLARLANSKCLELIAKGNILLWANDRNYRSAQITTDMRPLVSFSRVISRAMMKEKALRGFAEKSGTPVLTPPSEE